MIRALVIDDSRAMRLILTRTLGELGIEVSAASSGKEALATIDREGAAFQVVLVDWNMPEMTGLEVVQQLRTRSAFDDLKVMMVTTETEIEQMTRALEAGANEYVMKPFTREIVQDKLRLLGVIE